MVPPFVTRSFPTKGSVTHILYDRGVSRPATGGPSDDIEMSVNADDYSYGVKVDGKSEQFNPSDSLFFIEGAKFDAIYVKHDGDNEARLDIGQQLIIVGSARNTKYVASARYFDSELNFIDDERTYNTADFVYGFPSAYEAVPTNGRAAYQMLLMGSRSGTGHDRLGLVDGGGTISVDFGTGVVELNGRTYTYDTEGHGYGAFGQETLTGEALLKSGANEFSGTFTAFDPGQNGNSITYTGPLNGQFYGPLADEIGGTFYGQSEAGDYYSVAFVGQESDDLAATDTLASVSGKTRYLALRNSYHPNRSSIEFAQNEGFVDYDSDTATYAVPNSLYWAYFEPRNRTPENDNGDFVAYRSTNGLGNEREAEYQIQMFDGDADGVKLTYSTFLRIDSVELDENDEVVDHARDYIAFGNYTPFDQLPTSGHATYSGLFYGAGRNEDTPSFSFRGASSLSVNFLSHEIDASLSPSSTLAEGAGAYAASYQFTGKLDLVNGGAIVASMVGGEGEMRGRFFGDAAQEFVTTFTIADPTFDALDGVAFGVKD